MPDCEHQNIRKCYRYAEWREDMKRNLCTTHYNWHKSFEKKLTKQIEKKSGITLSK